MKYFRGIFTLSFFFVSLSFISPATLLCSLHSELICALLLWDQAAFQEKQPRTSWIMGRFVKAEIEVLFFWIIFDCTPYHSLLHFYSKSPPPKPLFLCFISSTWPPVASLLLLSDPLPHKHTPSPLSPKPFLPLHLCLMMLCVTRIIQHHPQARNQTHTHTHQANKCRSCWTRHVNIKAKDRDKCKAPFMKLLLCQAGKAFVYSDVEFLLRSHLYTFREWKMSMQ